MDPDTWNAYHVISNRARAVCYSVRQTEFRIKTEVTINSLASSARENLVSLQHLLVSFNLCPRMLSVILTIVVFQYSLKICITFKKNTIIKVRGGG